MANSKIDAQALRQVLRNEASEMPLGHNRKAKRIGGMTACYLYSTPVVQITEKKIICTTGGHNTQTTMRAIKGFLEALTNAPCKAHNMQPPGMWRVCVGKYEIKAPLNQDIHIDPLAMIAANEKEKAS